MLVTCPECQCKAKVIEQNVQIEEGMELYCQCQNLNCSTTFSATVDVVRVKHESED
ncbi:ogr/Delta-like zinc finger family protein [Vibrio lentus]|uniref:ogr/Delta-like zinc finger family protein n=1 Tax=Vibrio lentus TaxID=136468 RepID=UPI000C85CDA3|nr:ogr/Delta-like zinc finger family protein [Vibrio lentus]